MRLKVVKNTCGELNHLRTMFNNSYGRRQRDKLLEIKKEERKKQLERMEENAKRRPKTGRPSSRSASRVNSADSNGENPDKNLKYRQSLAARIKSEVVGKSIHKN